MIAPVILVGLNVVKSGRRYSNLASTCALNGRLLTC